MSTAHFLFLGRLNDFLARDQKEQQIRVDFQGRQSVKHLAESPGCRRDRTGASQRSEGTLGDYTGRRPLEVHPVLMAAPWRRFVLDNHLGRLAAYLRMLDRLSL
jgi:hypothetical protein